MALLTLQRYKVILFELRVNFHSSSGWHTAALVNYNWQAIAQVHQCNLYCLLSSRFPRPRFQVILRTSLALNLSVPLLSKIEAPSIVVSHQYHSKVTQHQERNDEAATATNRCRNCHLVLSSTLSSFSLIRLKTAAHHGIQSLPTDNPLHCPSLMV